jgi:glycine cleavage system pyridoxal-binding protein P
MLKFLGVKTIQELIHQAIPEKIRDVTALEDNAVGEAVSEH